jgi:aspartate kinase
MSAQKDKNKATWVYKYGGTSLGTTLRLQAVAQAIAKTLNTTGLTLAIVVSAQAGHTQALIDKAQALAPSPCPQLLDQLLASAEYQSATLLSLALLEQGIHAPVLNAQQAGIYTDACWGDANITHIDTQPIWQLLHTHRAVLVTGFQGVSPCGHITTLGRGGSDLTAVALAGALNAQGCIIFTDVNGVYTQDPHQHPQAAHYTELTLQELLKLTQAGARVMQTKAVQYAIAHGIGFEIRSSFNTQSGTRITVHERNKP